MMRGIENRLGNLKTKVTCGLAAGLILLCSSCLSKREYAAEEIKALMDQELNRKIVEYRTVKIQACQEEALREATRIVDSLVIIEAYFGRDTLSRPPKPIKPTEGIPEIKGPDTIQLKPLFEGKRKKMRVDSLGKKKNKIDTLGKKSKNKGGQ